MGSLLDITDLSVSFDTRQGEVQAVRKVSLSLQEGEVLAVVGESGCGKSVLCKSILRLLPDTARIKSGRIAICGADITACTEREMRQLRGSLCSMVFQDPMTSLDPTIAVGRQIGEAVRAHHPRMSKVEVSRRVIGLMELVGIEQPRERYEFYPHQFSGGMRQRIVLAIALAADPGLLLADEPTTALDVAVQAQILDLIREIQKTRHMAMILVSHDLGVVARIADRVAVMYAGKIVEIGTAEEIFYDPRHPYTWGLLRAHPSNTADPDRELYTIPGMPPVLLHPPKGDAFACRNAYALAIDYEKQPPMFSVTDTHHAATWLLDERAAKIRQSIFLSDPYRNRNGSGVGIRPEALPKNGSSDMSGVFVDVRELTYEFRLAKKIRIRAVDDVSFQIRKGEVFGLVGGSGSGKSTVARCIMNIYRPQEGQIFYKGIDVCDLGQYRKNKKMLQTSRQIIFQDPASSLDRHMKVSDIIAEPMAVHHIQPPRGSYREEAAFQLHYVGMDATYLDKYPSELSGGMRQRVAIARALSMEPELLVADEPVASLDVSIQAQIINLFRHLQKEHGFTFLFIAHDLSVVKYLCDRIGVMYQGRLVEVAPTEGLFGDPRHPYTKALLSAVPVPDPIRERSRRLQEFPDPGSIRGNLQMVCKDHYVIV